MDKQKIVNDWFAEHRVKVIDTNKRAYKRTRMNINNYFVDPLNYNIVNTTATSSLYFETEPLLTVEIAKSELEKLAEFESQVFNNMRQHGHYGLFEAMVEQKERENHLINKYPAVKKAFEHYSLLLKLAESGEL